MLGVSLDVQASSVPSFVSLSSNSSTQDWQTTLSQFSFNDLPPSHFFLFVNWGFSSWQDHQITMLHHPRLHHQLLVQILWLGLLLFEDVVEDLEERWLAVRSEECIQEWIREAQR